MRDGDAIALVAGDPWQGEERRLDELRALARALGVEQRVRFVGFRADVENVYGAADVVAVPSTQPDPLPNAALEAAAAGCCVVAADHGGLPEIIDDGVTGRLVTPRDPIALAAALDELRADPRRARGSAGRRPTRSACASPRSGSWTARRRSTTGCSSAPPADRDALTPARYAGYSALIMRRYFAARRSTAFA